MKQVEPKKEDKDSEDKHTNVEMSIGGPLALWIGLVAVAGVMQLFIFPALQNGGIVYPALATLNHIAAYGLYVPGVLVLPILAALWIGSRAGSTEGKINTVTYRAMINAVYASVIYLIEIFVLYIIANSTHTSVLSAVSLGLFVELVVALPVIVCIIVAPLFAIVSSARRF